MFDRHEPLYVFISAELLGRGLGVSIVVRITFGWSQSSVVWIGCSIGVPRLEAELGFNDTLIAFPDTSQHNAIPQLEL